MKTRDYRSKLAICMAHHTDYDGAYFTIQAIRMNHPGTLFEFVVVDNTPDKPEGEHLKNFLGHVAAGGNKVQYIPFTASVGTTQTRETAIQAATAENVLHLDCHVLLQPNSLHRLVDYYDNGLDKGNLLTGPLLYDSFGDYATHFNLLWRSGMWGVWASAWCCFNCGEKVSVHEHREKMLDFIELEYPHEIAVRCPGCGVALPRDIPWNGHHRVLNERGFKRACMSIDDVPFEIPAQGLGLFSMKKSAWLGFNPNFRGFGGEEGYIHQKYKLAGRQTMCLPFMPWMHRFGRPGGLPYPNTWLDRVRNYIIGHMELGMLLDDVHAAFVETQIIPEDQWKAVAKDPINFAPPKPIAPRTAHKQASETRAGASMAAGKDRKSKHGLPLPDTNGMTVEQLLIWTIEQPRDLNKHLRTLQEYASRCSHVTEMSKRRESTVALAAAGVDRLISFQEEQDELLDLLFTSMDGKTSTAWTYTKISSFDNGIPAIPDTDMLFIDTRHNGKRLRLELQQALLHVRKYIVIHDTVLYGSKGDDGGDGLIAAMQEMLVANREWFVAYHTKDQFGLTVLSKDPASRPPHAIHAWPPGYGPGTTMFKMLQDVGITSKPGCSCKATAEQMDLWGVSGCREPDNLKWVIDRVTANAENWSWGELVQIALKAAATPSGWKLAWHLNPTDVYGSLVRHAIDQAEKEEKSFL